ncbi:MAG: sigma-54-dependent Fis family transcriptional regulator [Myxococcales bacterium]|nr:sigma-54-dependent Fis family transcriptional regulator [Myxococcales bacterium]
MCAMLRVHLERRGFAVTTCGVATEAFAILRRDDFDVVVTDLNMREMSGLELCQQIVADRPDIPVLVITAFGSLDAAIGAIRAGGYDFIPKPFEIEVLVVALNRAIEHRTLRAEVTRLRQAVAGAQRVDELLGDSAAMRRVFDVIERVRDSDATVLITGESGTGKELVARALHRRSRRAGGPFVAINCAALPEGLLESELFGHVRGAFTDAHATRLGLFAQADGGTLFLDEIGELPPGTQAKLLRALQERTVRPLGGEGEVAFDARLVAATNLDLEAAVRDRRFREDLFYRLNVVNLELPPLRTRDNDVLLLAQHFLGQASATSGKRVTGLSPAAARRLVSYPWPGNVRELQNCIERAVAMAQYDQLALEDLPPRVREHQRAQVVLASDDPTELAPLEAVERQHILRVLAAVGGNKKDAARILGVDRTTLYRKLDRYGEPAEPKPR